MAKLKVKKTAQDKKAQFFVELALILGITTAVVLTMFHYYGRSLQGKLKESADNLGGSFVANSGSGGTFGSSSGTGSSVHATLDRSTNTFAFHTGALGLGMSMGYSHGDTTTTEVVRLGGNTFE